MKINKLGSLILRNRAKKVQTATAAQVIFAQKNTNFRVDEW